MDAEKKKERRDKARRSEAIEMHAPRARRQAKEQARYATIAEIRRFVGTPSEQPDWVIEMHDDPRYGGRGEAIYTASPPGAAPVEIVTGIEGPEQLEKLPPDLKKDEEEEGSHELRDWTAEKEAGIAGSELPYARERRSKIEAWRERQARGEDEPRWGEWSEFRVELADGRTVAVVYEPDRHGGTSAFEFHGPMTSTGFRSHFATHGERSTLAGGKEYTPRNARAGETIAQYAERLAREWAEETAREEGKGAKRERREAKKAEREAKEKDRETEKPHQIEEQAPETNRWTLKVIGHIDRGKELPEIEAETADEAATLALRRHYPTYWPGTLELKRARKGKERRSKIKEEKIRLEGARALGRAYDEMLAGNPALHREKIGPVEETDTDQADEEQAKARHDQENIRRKWVVMFKTEAGRSEPLDFVVGTMDEAAKEAVERFECIEAERLSLYPTEADGEDMGREGKKDLENRSKEAIRRAR